MSCSSISQVELTFASLCLGLQSDDPALSVCVLENLGQRYPILGLARVVGVVVMPCLDLSFLLVLFCCARFPIAVMSYTQ